MLHEIHAELLQVKKAQYEEEIDEKNKELQQLKLALEKTQILNFWKVSEDPMPLLALPGIPHGHT